MRIDELHARLAAENPEIEAVAHETDPPVFLALNVVRLRTARGMTQAQLAQAIGVAQPRIATIERGDANPRLVTLSKLAHALGVTLSELLIDRLNVPRDARLAARDEPVEPPRKRKAV